MLIIRKKKRLPDKSQQQQKQIYVSKFCQQPRSRRGSKPRTDFSLFISSSAADSSSSSSSSMLHHRHPGATSECSRYGNGQSQVATSSLGQTCQAVFRRRKKEMPSFPLVQCSVIKIVGEEKNSSSSISEQIPQTESVAQDMILENCDDGDLQESVTAGELASTPNKSISQVVESNDVRMAAGSIVWAKTANEMWWPAKVMEGKTTADVSSDQGVNGHVQVQYFGNHENAWLTPEGNISLFDECFKERSCNPLAAFQDALKQALYCKEQLRCCWERDGVRNSSQEQPSVAPLDKCIEPSSSRTEDSLEKRRGKRNENQKFFSRM
ncbi:uncharacterized protein LOC113307575 isoform X2 [Papaver somniferum]|uniref:uncharacterized protein LOC113307575 isoform X2 n=1 Tax=Papaver somniferum TaxID=3469 RepID=UPI000E704F5F|nr:uncharacterized protein LOC113307575 isoform X2 [Papaver somniferum]